MEEAKVQIPYYVGLAVLSFAALRISLKILCAIKGHFTRATVNFKDLGAWAVVTGSTDGIGKAYAEELAKHGLNIFLLSRSQEKLKDVAAEIQSAYHVQTKWLAVDFSSPNIYSQIESELSSLDVGILVNNVGMGYEHPDFFHNISQEVIQKIINVNMLSLSMMTRIVLPGMLEKKNGLVINVSSASGSFPAPLLTVYGASKSYVNAFSEALAVECRNSGVIIQNVAPFFVATKLSKMRSAMLVPTPTSYVKQTLKTVGHYKNTHGAILHALQGYLMSFVPDRLHSSIVLSMMKSTRARALKKKAAAAKAD